LLHLAEKLEFRSAASHSWSHILWWGLVDVTLGSLVGFRGFLVVVALVVGVGDAGHGAWLVD
jgi:hypothetical protein